MDTTKSVATLFLALVACTAEGGPPIEGVDRAFSTEPIWDDGRAEVAFYEVVWRGEKPEQFTAATYLVKQPFDPRIESKAQEPNAGASAFKLGLFYEVTRGSEQLKRSWVANMAQENLAPLKLSFNSFDWCSNRYEELAFHGRSMHVLVRSDDYGNLDETHSVGDNTLPPLGLLLAIRALDLSSPRKLRIVSAEGRSIDTNVTLIAEQNAGDGADRIRVVYEEPILLPWADAPAREEIYSRGRDRDRPLLSARAADGRHELRLIERVRSAYWQENVFDKLSRVSSHP